MFVRVPLVRVHRKSKETGKCRWKGDSRYMIDEHALNAFISQVDRLLWEQWDPIGCGVPKDEYTSYARVVADKAARGETAEQIIDYLYWAESYNMGLTCTLEGVRQRTTGIVDTILDMAAMQFRTKN